MTILDDETVFLKFMYDLSSCFLGRFSGHGTTLFTGTV
jgi:hypothetical protein